MEIGVESSNGGKLSRKSRSVDLKSIYELKSLKKNDKVSVSLGNSLKRKIGSDVQGEDEKSGGKRSKKELPLSFLKTGGKNAKKSLAEVYSDENGSGHGTVKDTGFNKQSISGPGVHSDRNEDDNGNGMFLGLEGSTIRIPKKRRGFVRRRKHDSQHSLKSVLLSDHKCEFGDEEVKLDSKTHSGMEISGAKGMEVKESDELDEKLISPRHPDQNDHVGQAVTDKDIVDSSPKKSRKKRRRKGVEQVGANTKEVVEPLLDDSTKAGDDSVEEDEQNLEENAAMMLSSRFDPSCTGFSLNNKSSASPTTDRSLFRSHNSGQSDSAAGSDFVSPDMADRVLRPRSQHGSKSLSRKRRHFYEVCLKQFNGRRLLNKRIKVFWPLDESWYRGLINDYDDEKELHHIKYDDRDEEWVDLGNEKFKLLLFPSEFPNRSSRRRTGLTDTESHSGKADGKNRKEGRNKKLNADDDNSASNNVDTMPIISWVTRTKSLSSRAGKKQKTSVSSMHSIASLMSDDNRSSERRVNDGTTKRGSSKSRRDPVLPKGYSPGRKKPSLSSTTFKEKKSALSFKEDKLPIVYFRRHRKTDATLRKHDRISSSSVGADETERIRSLSTSLRKLDPQSSYRMLQEILSELTILPTQPELCDLELSVPVLPLLNHYFGENDKFFGTFFLLHQGSLMMVWPKVRLEILLVDNLSELRFLLFEGSLEEAMAFCFLLLRVMDCGNGAENNEEEQPVMSINLRLTRMQGIKTHFLFAAYRFVSLKHSRWMYIDSNLMTKCLFARRLSPSECLNGNVSVLQDYASKLPAQFVCGCLIKGLHSLKEPGITRETCSHSDDVIQLFRKFEIDGRKIPLLTFPDSATLNVSKTAVIKLLMDGFYSDIMAKEHNTVEANKNCSTIGTTGDLPDVQHVGHGSQSNLSFPNGNYGVVDRTWGGTDRSSFSSTGPCDPVSEISKQINDCENSTIKSEKYPRHLPQSGRVRNDSPSFSNGTIGVKKHARPHGEELPGVLNSSALNGAVVANSNPTALRSMHLRRRTSPSYRSLLSMGSDVKDDSFKNGFVNGPKRPRTQVSYILPYGSLDLSPKSSNSQNRIASHKRIRRLKEKDAPDISKKNLDLFSCDANVLISLGDRGWRETGAVVVLELDNQNEWKLVVKVSGAMQYSYKAHQFLQPGSTNRFTHAMMWRGGKDWVLEFTNRSQWTLFKEMHEECYNRNVRAALVKAIPIPGVRVIDENEDSGTEELFVRSSSKYLQQVESDVEMALNPSRVLYDMDSEDEQWILANCSSDAENSWQMEISDEIFEKTMDAFEKAAYTGQHDHFSSNEIEEFVAEVTPIEIVKSIHEFWWKKRQKKGMPLIRHLQPPLWERYQLQVKEWELAVNKTSSTLSSECQKVSAAEKPPMFAFCMKPRGLEVPNKGSKQRSRRKFSASGTAAFADQDGFHALGRRSSGNSFGNGKFLYPSNRGEFLGDFASPRLYSPRDVASPSYLSLGNDGYYNSRVSRNKPKRVGALISPRDPISYGQRDAGWKNGVKHWNSDWSDHRSYYLGGSDGSDVKKLNRVDADDFTIRDASGTARHSQKIARLKREKAERMFRRADRAVHKALAALMAAEAIKAASEDRNENGLVVLSSNEVRK